MTLEEYAANEKEMDEFRRHPPGWDDPNRYKKQSAEFCNECFPIIQKQFPEMADYELVEPMDGAVFLTWSIFVHLNFKAKPKNGGDSSVSVYFVECDMNKEKVLCFSKINIDPSSDTSGYPHCCHCHPKGGSGYAGYVYHPHSTDTWLRTC